MSHLIKVTNKNNFEIVDYFDGMPYKFTPDEPINVPLQAMQHIFGVDFPADQDILNSFEWREEAFNAVSRRWGWNAHDKESLARNKATFSGLKFVPIIMQQVELVAKAGDLTPPREQKSIATAKGGKFKPRADEIEEDEEAIG